MRSRPCQPLAEQLQRIAKRLQNLPPVRLGIWIALVILLTTGVLAAIGCLLGPPVVEGLYHGDLPGPLREIRIASGRNKEPIAVYYDWLYFSLHWIVGAGIAWAGAALVTGFVLKRRESGKPLPARQATASVIALCAVALLIIATLVLERFPNSADEYAYLFQAETLSHGQLWNEATPLPDHFRLIHIAQRDGKWVSRFPPGWPAMLSALAWARIPMWLLNPSMGLVVLGLAVLLFTELGLKRAAPIAVAALATSPFFLFNAASYFNHVSCLAFLMVAAWLATRYRKNGATSEALGVGLALGIAFTIRYYTAALVAVPLLIYLVSAQPHRHARAVVFVCLGGALPVALLLAYQAAITGSPWLMVTRWVDPTEGLGFVKGHTPARAVEALILHLGRLVVWASPALLFLLAGIAWSRKASVWVWVTVGAFVACLLGHAFYYNIGGNQYGPRFYFEGWALATLGAVAWAFQDQSVTAQRLPRFAVLFAVFAGVFTLPLHAYHEHRVVEERLDLERLVEREELEDAIVIVSDGTGVARRMPPYDLTRNGTALDGEILYVLDLGADTPRQLRAHFPKRQLFRYRRAPDEVHGNLTREP